MSLRIKTILTVGCTLLLFILFVSAVTVAVLFRNATRLEDEKIKTNITRVINAIVVEEEALKTKLSDWSAWDDTYAFVVDGNPRYIESNLLVDTYKNLQINTILFMDVQGEIVYGKTYDATSGGLSSPSAQFIEQAQRMQEAIVSDPGITDVTGIVQMPEGLLLLSVQPIIKSDGEGPPRGGIVFSKPFDDAYVTYISGVTETECTVHPYTALSPGEYDEDMVARLLSGGPPETVISDDQTIAGYASLQDVDGKSVALLAIDQVREFRTLVIQNLQYLLIHFIGGTIACLIIILIAIERFIMSPLLQMRREISTIEKSGDLAKRLTELTSHDELGSMTKEINKMLQSLEYTQKLLSGEKEKSHAYIDVINMIILVISIDETIMLLNRKGCEILEYTDAEVVGKNWFDLCIPQDVREKVREIFHKVATGEVEPYEEYENAVVTKSGKRKMIAWKNTIIRNKEGAIIASLSSGEDVTNRTDSEKKLKEREKQLTFAQQMAGIGGWEWYIHDNSVIWSEQVSSMFGIKETSLGGMNNAFLRFVHPDDHEAVESALISAQKEHTPISLSAKFLRPDGETRMMSLQGQVILDDHNNPSKIIGIAKDITEEKRSEERILARSRELESMNQGMVGREVRMAELKKENEMLKNELESYKKSTSINT
jgi:PAS domain S-box-containing protein